MSSRHIAISVASLLALVALLYVLAAFPWVRCAIRADTEIVGGPFSGVCITDTGFIHRYATDVHQVRWSQVGHLVEAQGPDGEPTILVAACGAPDAAEPATPAGWALLGLQPQDVPRAKELMTAQWVQAGHCSSSK